MSIPCLGRGFLGGQLWSMYAVRMRMPKSGVGELGLRNIDDGSVPVEKDGQLLSRNLTRGKRRRCVGILMFQGRM